jgi:stage II sporulation protein D
MLKSQEIRVQIGTYARFAVSGHDLILNGTIRIAGSSAFNIRCGYEGAGGAAYVEFGAGRRSLGKLEIGAAGGFVQVSDKPYRSTVTVIPQDRNCLVVNTLDLEKYLAGVISREMSPSWPMEALKAQAVASRSYAVYQMRVNKNRDFDLESTTQDQVYEGAESESARAIQAVTATHGQVLVFNDTALKAYFHANCGGITEVPDLVWGGDVKSFRPVVCPYHKKQRDRLQWSVHLSREQVERALRRISGLVLQPIFRLASLEAGAPDASRRLSDVVVSDARGNSLLVSANTFRNAVGNTKLKSTAFKIEKDGDGYRLEGEGNGHGVGMCQIGARTMAEEGRTFEQILQFYYPLAKIRPLL